MLSFMLKPTSFKCNIKCDYCFYLEKEQFMSGDKQSAMMSLETAEHFIHQHISQSAVQDVYFTWQGGEPLMAGLAFFAAVIRIQQRFAAQYNKTIHNAIQTNGLLINPQWADFFKQNKILIGISIDGDEELHNRYRVSSSGKGTFRQVKQAIELLQQYAVEFNTLTVINNINAAYPLRVYQFLKQLGSRYMQFIPVVETMGVDANFKPNWLSGDSILPVTSHFSVSADQYAYFINTLFDEWLAKDVGKISVQLFESIFARFCGVEALMCIYRQRCGGENLALEANGDVYACDHFVYPEYKLGNIDSLSQAEIQRQSNTLLQKKADLNRTCQACEWQALCYGGCPKHRFVTNQDGEKHNYFCSAYRQIFQHLTPAMNFMVTLKEQNVPLELVKQYREQIYH
ncbi:anaerobic sulfatase maturase [Pasteurella testudinis]|uniref:anaerobic sulfatase maturase n=1 Tax=Pasteurella testudinis TaxID=761 RepID=UPI00405813B4